jgi:hypothetical protein
MNLVIGCLGDVCCIFLVVPLELMSMRQSEGEGLITMFRKIYSTSGIAGFYQGWTAYLFGSVMPAIQYTGFDQGKRFYLAWLADGSKTLSPVASFILGAVSRAVADLICYPIRVPQNVQQSSVHELRNESFWTIVTSVLRTEGIGGLYNGIMPQLTQGVRTVAHACFGVLSRAMCFSTGWMMTESAVRRRQRTLTPLLLAYYHRHRGAGVGVSAHDDVQGEGRCLGATTDLLALLATPYCLARHGLGGCELRQGAEAESRRLFCRRPWCQLGRQNQA